MTRPLAAILLLSIALPAGAAPPAPPPAPAKAPAPRGLQTEPMLAEAIGLTMYLPAGGTSRTAVGADGIAYLANDDPQTWTMRISTLLPAVGGATAMGLATEQLQAIQKTGRPSQVLFNGPRTFGGVEGHLLYVQQTLNTQPVVNGWLILPTSPQSFVVATLFCAAEDFPRLRQSFDACFETIKLRSAPDLTARREANLGRGRAMLATLTPERLHAAAGERQWYRVYRPGVSGRGDDDSELAYMSMQLAEGMRGELNPERAADSFSAMEAEQGLLLRLEARYIDVEDPKPGHYVDVDARYWMSWDRQNESWSIRYTRRIGTASRTAAETGVRTGTRLEVIRSSKEQQTREPEVFQIPDVYLSQAEVLMLGRLLGREGAGSGDMAFAAYDSNSRRIVDRVETWKPEHEGGDTWSLNTVKFTDTGPIRQIWDGAGRCVKRVDPDGTTTQRMELADLQRLWQSKGLPAGADGSGGTGSKGGK